MVNFSNKKTQSILAFFFLNPDQKLYLKELSNQLDLDNGNLSRYLSSLVAEGVLTAKEEGRQKYFSLNSAYPVLPELKKMMAPEIKPEYLLKEIFSKIKGLNKAYLFGSYASGEFNSKSDLDILLIGSHNPIDVRRELVPLQKRLGREINAIDYTEQEYKKKITEKDDFLARVLSEKKIILK
jgi:predicted nucleotidyltransferase